MDNDRLYIVQLSSHTDGSLALSMLPSPSEEYRDQLAKELDAIIKKYVRR